MQPVSGPGASQPGDRSAGATTSTTTSGPSGARGGEQPLTTAQRATLENLVLKVAALTTSKVTEIWSNVKQGLGLTENAELQSRHFQPAEQLLQTRLTQAQDSGERRQLLQRLTDVLPQGNNRQAVSDFIRRQFGHTELGSLNSTQLRQVVTLLQNGQITPSTVNAAAIPQPAAANAADRPLSPAEQNSLNQSVARLASQSGEPAAKIWTTLMTMQNLSAGESIPAKNLPLLTQFLQAQAVLQHASPAGQTASQQQPAPANTADNATSAQSAAGNTPQTTALLSSSQPGAQTTAFAASPVAILQSALPQPLSAQEQQMLLDYSQHRFNVGLQTPLTPLQLNEVLTFLFTQRLQRSQENDWAAAPLISPQPLLNPLIASLPPEWQALFHKPMFLVIVSVCVAAFLMWVLL